MPNRARKNVQRDSRFREVLWLLPLIVVLAGPVLPAREAASKPPKTRTDGVTEVLHGVEIVDPYRWLEDKNSPETRAWIDVQNEHARSIIGSLPGRERLKQRLGELLKIDETGIPQERNGRYFFSKRLANQDLASLYQRKGAGGKDEVLIDPHALSPDRTTSVELLDVSKDGTLMAYGVRQGGEDEVEIRLLDVDTRKELPDRFPRGRYNDVSFKPDKSGFYYSHYGADGLRIHYHPLGTDPTGDREVFGEGLGKDKIVTANLSEDGRYLLLHVFHGSAGTRSEIYYQDVARQGPIVPIVNDLDARFIGQVAGDRLILQTTWKAPKGRILAVDLKNPARDRWREIVPESKANLEGVSLAGGRLLVHYLENVQSRLKVFDPDGRHVRDIALPAIGSVGTVVGRWGSQEAFVDFSSFHIPATIYRYDVAKSTQEVWARRKVPIASEKFEVKQVWYESKDKTRVPMFLVHSRGNRLGGSNPALLTAYGGFAVSRTPAFSPNAAVWVEHGGVYAVANLRGGGEFGEEWHQAGMLEKKQNVFDDFIAAAGWLIQNGYTKPSRLAISGGSNGGLLVGAAFTQRPELFQAVVCSYPLLDMIRYQKFLVARFWVPEYGSSENPGQFPYLYAYSPYHRVKPDTKYPAVLFVSGDADTRVDPLHARKMTALLQSATGSDRPVLLRYDTKSGHISGARPVSLRIEDLTDQLSFLFWQLGVAPDR